MGAIQSVLFTGGLNLLETCTANDASSIAWPDVCLFVENILSWQVEELHLIWYARRGYAMPHKSITQWCKQLQPQLAPSLTILILENLKHEETTSKGGLLVSALHASHMHASYKRAPPWPPRQKTSLCPFSRACIIWRSTSDVC